MGLLSVLSAALYCGGAQAEPDISLALRPAPAGDRAFLVGGGDARGHGVLRARLLAETAREPLVLVTPAQRSYRVVEQQSWLHAGLSLAIAHRVLVYAALPVLLGSNGEPAPDTTSTLAPPDEGGGLGDTRLGARVRLLGLPSSDARFGAGFELVLPTGEAGAYASDGGVGYRGHVALSAGGTRAAIDAEIAYAGRESTRLPSVLPTRVGSAIEAGIALRMAFDSHSELWLGPELSGRFTVGAGARFLDPRSTLVHLLLTARHRPFGTAPFELGAAFGPSLGQAPGSADFRVLVFVAYAPEAPPPAPDQDGDGVADANDICLRLPGTRSEDPLMNGCPPVPLDTDGDSVPDGFDACPRAPGEATAERRTHGCPRKEGIGTP